MPRTRITLDIPQPCEEHWDAMQPVAGGRHCAACAKTVIDFTRCTDEELIRFFSNKANAATTCCRLRDDQMNRTMALPPETAFGKRGWSRAAALLIGAQVLLTQAVAQTAKRAHQTVAPSKKGYSGPRSLDGRVTTGAGHYLPPGLSFLLQVEGGDSIRVTPGNDGCFTITLPAGFKNGRVYWAMQPVADGVIAADSVMVDAKVLKDGLAVQWMAMMRMQPVVVTANRPQYGGRSYGGLPVVQYNDIKKKPSFFGRLFGRRAARR